MWWNLPLFDTRVGRRLVVLFLLSAIAPISLMAIFAYHHVARQLEAQSRSRLETLAKTTGMGITQRLLMIRSVLEEHATRVLDQDRTKREDRGDGRKFPPGVIALWLGSLGDVSSRHPRGIDQLQAGRALLETDPRSGDVQLGVLVPDTETVLWGTADPGFLWGTRDGTLPFPEGVDLCVFARNGHALTCTVPDSVALRQALAVESDGTGLPREIRWRGESGWQMGSIWNLFLAFEFGAEPWHTVVSEPVASVTAPVRTFGATFSGIVVLTLFLVLGLSAWLIRRSMAPLRELQEATVRLAGQDLRHRVAIRSASRDEFHDLAHSFNRMAGQIERHVDTLQHTNAIDRAILSTLNRTEAAEVILQHGLDLLPCDVMGFSLARTEDPLAPWDFTMRYPGTPLSCLGSVCWHGGQRERLIAEPGGLPMPPDMMETLRSGQLTSAAITHGWAFPVIVDRRLVGMLFLGSCAPTTLDEPTMLLVRHLADQAAVAISNIHLVEALGQLHRGALQALARTIDAKSPWTAGHSERVTSLAVALGEWIGLPEPEIERLHRGGLLHDIGKIGIPGEILDKAGPLTTEERAIIETHPVVGARILTPVSPYADVLGIVRSHHERWDGTGYPDRLAGEAIPLLARVLSVADVYDAISSARPYRGSMPHDQVLAIIRQGVGTAFDPAVATAFLAMMDGAQPGNDPLPRWTGGDLSASSVLVGCGATPGTAA